MCGCCEGHGWHGGWEGRGHHHHSGHEDCGCEHGHRGHGGCCGGGHERGPHHGYGGRCGEGRPGGFRRRFVSRAERIAALEAYLAELRAEVAAVEEHLADLKKAA